MKKQYLFAFLAIALLVLVAWVPQNTGYNANQFYMGNVGLVQIKSGVLITNPVVSGLLMADAALIPLMTNTSASAATLFISNSITMTSNNVVTVLIDPTNGVVASGVRALTLGANNSFVTNNLTLGSGVTASTVIGTDAGKNVVSYAGGNGITIGGGAISATGTNVNFVGTTFANLPVLAANQYGVVFCTDVLTPWGTQLAGAGALVYWDGGVWRTTSGNIQATTNVRDYFIYCITSGVNASTPVGVHWQAPISSGATLATTLGGSRQATANNGTLGVDGSSSTGEERFTYSTTTAASCGPNSAFSTAPLVATGIMAAGGRYSFDVACSATEKYWAFTGTAIANGNNTNFPTSGAFFLCDVFTNSTAWIGTNGNVTSASATYTNNWIAVCGNGTAFTMVDTRLPVTISTTAADRLAVILTTTNAVFYTNGAVAVSNILTLPTANSGLVITKTQITKYLGTTARVMYEYNPSAMWRHAAFTY